MGLTPGPPTAAPVRAPTVAQQEPTRAPRRALRPPRRQRVDLGPLFRSFQIAVSRPGEERAIVERGQRLQREAEIDEGLRTLTATQLQSVQDPEGAFSALQELIETETLPQEVGIQALELAQGIQNRAAMTKFLRNRVETVDDPGAQAALSVLQSGGSVELAGEALEVATRGRFDIQVSPELGGVFISDPVTGSTKYRPIEGLPAGVAPKPTLEQNALSIFESGLPITDLMRQAQTDPLRRIQLGRVFQKNTALKNDHDRWAVTLFGPQGTEEKLGVRNFTDLAQSFPGKSAQVIERVNLEEAKVRGAGALAAEKARIRARKEERPGPQEFWVDLKGVKEALNKGKELPPTKRLLNRRGELESMFDRGDATLMDRAGFEALRGFDAADAVIISEISRTAELLPDASFQAVLNRVVFPVQRFAGIPGVGQQTGAAQAFNLIIGRILQGSARLSDLDLRAASLININDGDTRASARIKIQIFRRLSRNMRAAFMGIDTRDRSVFSEKELNSLQSQIESARQFGEGGVAPGRKVR